MRATLNADPPPPSLREAQESALLDLLLATSTTGVAFLDRGLRYLRVNDELARMNGRGAAEHLGRTVREVLGEEEGGRLAALLAGVLESGQAVLDLEVEAESPATPGEVRSFRGSFHPVRDAAGEVVGVAAVVAETTGQRRAEAERDRLLAAEQEARRRAERLQAVAAALSEAVTLAEVGDAAMRQGVVAMGASAGVVALLVPGGDALEILSSIGYGACMGAGTRWPLPAPIPIAEAARTGEAVFVESPAAWAARYAGKTPAGNGTHAWAALPLAVRGEVRGALLWSFAGARAFPEDDRALLLALARQCAQALERARAYQAEREARAEAEEANRAKAEFLAVMSHELRTPLNAIGGYAELLEMGVRGPVTAAQREDLRRIVRNHRHLLSLINDVLNFARIEAGHLELSPADLSPGELLADLEALVAPQLAAKGLRCDVLPAGGALPRVRADAEKARQVLLNLLSNAIKFTPAGGRVTVSCEAVPGGAAVRVADTGVGIPPEKAERVFDPFVQLGRGLTSSHEGTGLGLAISRDLARAMGGDLTVQSRPGEGSVFTLLLPAAEG